MKRGSCAVTAGACVLLIMVTLSASAQHRRGIELVPDPVEDPRGFIRQRTRCADLIIMGVVSKVNDRVTYKRSYYTFVTVDVDSVLSGTLDSSSITFWHSGGVGESLALLGSDQTAFLPRQEVLLFLHKRPFWESVEEGKSPPEYLLRGAMDHYVLVDGEVRRGGKANIARWGDVMRLVPEPSQRALYSRQFMLEEIGSYLASVRPESMAVRAEAVVLGEVVGRRLGSRRTFAHEDTVEFRRDVVLKGSVQDPIIRIKVRSVVPMYDCFLDQPALALGQRMVLFLSGTDGTFYVPTGGWAASRAVANDGDERALIERITSAIQ